MADNRKSSYMDFYAASHAAHVPGRPNISNELTEFEARSLASNAEWSDHFVEIHLTTTTYYKSGADRSRLETFCLTRDQWRELKKAIDDK